MMGNQGGREEPSAAARKSLFRSPGPEKEDSVFCDRLSELKNDHKNSNEQQNPAQPNNNPGQSFGDTNKNHEEGQNDQESKGIDNTVRKNQARKDLLEDLVDPYTDLMGKKINEGEDVVKDLIQRLQIRRFLRK
jgi:hypothetical protein